MPAKLLDFFFSVSQTLFGVLSVDWGKYPKLKQFFEALSAMLTQWFTDPTALAAILTFLAMSAWIVRKFFWTRRSKLLQPDRFKLSADDPRHLAGRTTDVRTLAELCANNALTFLIGESGAGKSALVKAGLLPYLKTPNPEQTFPLLPLLIDASGLAWEGGLRAAWEEAVQQMPEEWLPLLGDAVAPDPADRFLPIQINPHKRPPKKRLLLVLDQIDDYFLAHPDAFVGKDGVVAEPLQVLSANRDWKMLADKVIGKQLHLLLVCRTDAAMLSALTFTGSRSFRLRRIETNRMGQLLDEITRPDAQGEVVEYPEGGWLQLKDRLLDDLADADGQILPVRLSLALDVLSRSRGPLTLSRYTQHGGVRGLERRYLESYWPEIKRLGYEPKAVLRALLLLIAEDNSKTLATSRAAFEQALTKGQTPGKDSSALLEYLVQYRLLRIVRGQSKQDEHTLLLYHDYLAHVVREAYRQANRWTELLRVKSAEFNRALTWQQQWAALLSLRDQLRLAVARLRGRFNYGDYRRLAGWSLLRLVPLLLTLSLVLAAGWKMEEMQQEREVANLLNRVGSDEQKITQDELDAWRTLARLSEPARIYAVRLALSNDGIGIRGRLSAKTGLLAHAVVGFDPGGHLSANIAREVLVTCVAPSKKVAQDVESFCGKFAGGLNLKPGSPVLKSLAAALVERMKAETDFYRLVSLGEALGSLVGKLDAADVQPGAAALVERMKTETDPYRLKSLGMALEGLSGKLDGGDVKPLAAALAERMKSKTTPDLMKVSVFLLLSLSGKLDSDDAKPVVAMLVEAMLVEPMKAETNVISLAFLGRILACLSSKLDSRDVQQSAAVLVSSVLAAKTDSDYQSVLSLSKQEKNAMEVISYMLDRCEFLLGSTLLLPSMEAETNSEVMSSWLGKALAGFSGKLDSGDAKPLAAALVERMKTETNSDRLSLLGRALAGLSGKLDGGDVKPGAAALVERMRAETDSDRLSSLGKALAGVSGKLDTGALQPGAVALVERMKTETDSRGLSSLGAALGGLAGKLDAADVKPGAAALVERMKTETDSYSLTLLGKALAGLSGKLDSGDVQPGAAALVDRMKAETDSYSLTLLGKALADLSGKLDCGDVKPGAIALVERIKAETDSDKLSSLAEALADLGKKPRSSSNPEEAPVRIADYVELLRQPLIVGKPQKALLDGLGKITGQDFHGDLWQFVDWAQTEEGRKLVPSLE